MHNSFCNTKALEKVHLEGSGIWTWWNRRKASRLPGVKFDSDGNLTGVFLGLDATYLLISIFQQLFKVRRMLEAMHYLTELGRQNGITTMAEMYLGVFALPMELRLFSFFYNSPNTPMRVVCTIAADKAVKFFGGIWGRTSLAVDRVMSLQKTSTAKVIFNGGVKFFCDDAFFSLTMQVRSYTHTFPTLFYFSNSPNTQLANSSSIFTVFRSGPSLDSFWVLLLSL